MSNHETPLTNLDRWFVCPVRHGFHDRTQGFLVCSSIAEIALSLAKTAEPKYEFTGETIPYKDYVPMLSLEGMISDLKRWIGFLNHPNGAPLGTVVQMD